MYLAIVSTTIDDLPICVRHTFRKAYTALEDCTQADLDAVYRVLGRDEASIACGSIIEFNDDGRPCKFHHGPPLPQFAVNDYTEEEEGDGEDDN